MDRELVLRRRLRLSLRRGGLTDIRCGLCNRREYIQSQCSCECNHHERTLQEAAPMVADLLGHGGTPSHEHVLFRGSVPLYSLGNTELDQVDWGGPCGLS